MKLSFLRKTSFPRTLSMITAYPLRLGNGSPSSSLLNSTFRLLLPTLSSKFIWTGHFSFYPSLFLASKALSNICLFPRLWCWKPSFSPSPHLSSSYMISTSIWTKIWYSQVLYLRKKLRNFRDPTSPHPSTPPRSPWALATPGNCVTLPSFTSSSHPPFSLTLCLLFNLSERNEVE